MQMTGELSGMLELIGGGSNVSITPTLTEGEEIADFEIDGTPGKLYAPEALITSVQIPLLMVGKQLRIDLSSYYTKAEIAIELQTYQKQMESIDSQVDISGTHSNQISLTFDIDDYQKKLIAGTNITIDPVTNEISASGGGGGLDLPTDGTPVAIGTFGNMTLYAQSVSVAANTYSLCRFWTGQAGDIVLSANAIGVCNNNPPTKMVVPSSIPNIVSFSWYTDDYEALPHLSIYSTLDSNLWSGGATIKGMVIFAR